MVSCQEVRRNIFEDLRAARGILIFAVGVCLIAVAPSLGAGIAVAGLYLIHKDKSPNH